MNFPYPIVTNFTSSVNTAYYFNAEDVNVYKVKTNISESFFGKSEKDVVEFSYYNLSGVQNGWTYKQPKIIYISDVGNYTDVDYKKVNYLKSTSKVIIICKVHGEFLQKPGSHVCGRGCPKCAGVIVMTKNDFNE